MLGAGTVIGPHTVIHSHARIGERNRIHAHAVIADTPQDYWTQVVTDTYIAPSRLNVAYGHEKRRMKVEGDWMIDERDLEFSGAYNQPAGTSDRYQLAHWGTVRGRLGYAISRHVLVSATAGLAIVDFDYRDNDTNLSTTGSEHALGWAAGAALDLGLHEHARLRVDGLYVDVHAWDVYGATTDQDVDSDIFVVRSSLIWAF